MERTSKGEVNIPSIKEIRLERRRLARQNRKRRIFFNTTITWDGTNRTGVLTSLTGNQEDGKITFAPNDDKSELVTNVVNKKGSTLPSTGGIGTTIFTIAGCVIMIAAAGLFFASRKKSDNK